ncbi:MAG: bifunctional diaminohydroxyphosphoribosylaminopyrimidine deaminase/5-amino-6-(5-phosphoribosylamino)uracil reductase RibD [Acidobacteria bacterium]|nr:bifunctional diaminohydroxyphosphoribosylaminopyrimidine deaminase/5-amino-6-(5-phosphoribosylamino)uracil reductase RibD [Acidobacteriota bacterium]
MRADIDMMRRALRLAERGRGLTSPNPPVGAVVASGGVALGEGWHRAPGLPHAEIEALEAAGDRARGATLYVTLEPCVHRGRTPPCVPSVIASGVTRVVIGTTDPNPLVNGAGARALAAAGVDVVLGVLEAEARGAVRAFAKHVRTGRPFVTAKLAVSLDGRVAAADGSSRWISGPAARRDVHRVRAASDAVLVGIGTVLADDPRLTCRLRGYRGRQPLRVVLDSSGRTPPGARVLDGAAPTLVITTDKAPDEALDQLRAGGAEVLRAPCRDGRVDVAAVLDDLGRRGLLEVLIEGGPTVVGEATERALVDRYLLYVAPKLLGPAGVPAIGGIVAASVADARDLTITSLRRVGADLRVEAQPRR